MMLWKHKSDKSNELIQRLFRPTKKLFAKSLKNYMICDGCGEDALDDHLYVFEGGGETMTRCKECGKDCEGIIFVPEDKCPNMQDEKTLKRIYIMEHFDLGQIDYAFDVDRIEYT